MARTRAFAAAAALLPLLFLLSDCLACQGTLAELPQAGLLQSTPAVWELLQDSNAQWTVFAPGSVVTADPASGPGSRGAAGGSSWREAVALQALLPGVYPNASELVAAGSINSALGLLVQQDWPLAFSLSPGGQLLVEAAAQPGIRGAQSLVLRMLPACNGVLYEVDMAPLPLAVPELPRGLNSSWASAWAQAASCNGTSVLSIQGKLPGFSIQPAAWSVYGFKPLLGDPGLAMTFFFVPDQALFNKANMEGLQWKLLAQITTAYVEGVLYYMLPRAYCAEELVEAGTLNTMAGELRGMYLPLSFTFRPQTSQLVVSGIQGSANVTGVAFACNSIIFILDGAPLFYKGSTAEALEAGAILGTPPVDMTKLSQGANFEVPGLDLTSFAPKQLPSGPPRHLTCSPPPAGRTPGYASLYEFSKGGARDLLPGTHTSLPPAGQPEAAAGQPAAQPAAAAGGMEGSGTGNGSGSGSGHMGIIIGMAVGASAACAVGLAIGCAVLRRRGRARRLQQQAAATGEAEELEKGGATAMRGSQSSLSSTALGSAVFGEGLPNSSGSLEARDAGRLPIGESRLHARAALDHVGSSDGSGSCCNLDTGQRGSLQSTGAELLLAALEPSDGGWRECVIDPNRIHFCANPDGSHVVLGQGAFATVYRVLLDGVEPHAAKVVPLLASSRRKQLFLKEVSLLRTLRHRHIVNFAGVCIDEDRGIIVMELMEGKDLHSINNAINKQGERAFAWGNRGKNVALDIARAINYLHRRHVTHFDIKSNNVLITRDLTAKLGDVGLARALRATHHSLSNQTPAGSFEWMAPEILMGVKCTSSVDIYSYGILLWELCTGEPPVRGALRDLSVPQDCPQDVADLFRECTSQDPTQRPTAPDLLRRLIDLCSQSPPQNTVNGQAGS